MKKCSTQCFEMNLIDRAGRNRRGLHHVIPSIDQSRARDTSQHDTAARQHDIDQCKIKNTTKTSFHCNHCDILLYTNPYKWSKRQLIRKWQLIRFMKGWRSDCIACQIFHIGRSFCWISKTLQSFLKKACVFIPRVLAPQPMIWSIHGPYYLV